MKEAGLGVKAASLGPGRIKHIGSGAKVRPGLEEAGLGQAFRVKGDAKVRMVL
jgi:hypothetical protein